MIDIQIGNSPPFPPFYPAFLRDACECKKCVDPSSKQKNFQTTDIPDNIKATSVKILPDGAAEVVWENDIRGFEAGHKSVYSNTMLKSLSTALNQRRARFGLRKRENWDKKKITKELDFVDYEHYMETEEGLLRALNNLHAYGLLVLRGVPASEKAVEDIALRIGNLRDTLYGRTWDVGCLLMCTFSYRKLLT
jgi:gamma-butyrobetaine dioxygenase